MTSLVPDEGLTSLPVCPLGYSILKHDLIVCFRFDKAICIQFYFLILLRSISNVTGYNIDPFHNSSIILKSTAKYNKCPAASCNAKINLNNKSTVFKKRYKNQKYTKYVYLNIRNRNIHTSFKNDKNILHCIHLHISSLCTCV